MKRDDYENHGNDAAQAFNDLTVKLSGYAVLQTQSGRFS
jgi:hypothetical protein